MDADMDEKITGQADGRGASSVALSEWQVRIMNRTKNCVPSYKNSLANAPNFL
jgi:hypothetical protein